MANTKIKNTVLDSSVISGQSTVTAASDDLVLIQDVSDSNNLKKALVSDFGGTPTSIADADADTKIQVEESSDEDVIRFDVGGTEYMTLTSNGKLNVTEIAHISSGNLEIGNGDEKQVFDASDATIKFQTADTERMRIFSDGDVGLGGAETGNIINSSSGVGFYHERGADTVCGRSGGAALSVLRQSSDGQLIRFKKAGSEVGDITVSSGNVSLTGFQGCHESSGIAENLPLGTVVSTIDELDSMDNGDDKPNHPKIKVSDAVGDSRVYGVLQSYSTERNNKPTVAAVGIGFILVTGACSGGDLLESNGDGTAKVQDDDIIRSKTIGKVTIGDSNTGVKSVSCVLYCG